MSRGPVTSWTLAIQGNSIELVFVGDLVEAESWAAVMSNGEPYVLTGADGQRSQRAASELSAPPTKEGSTGTAWRDEFRRELSLALHRRADDDDDARRKAVLARAMSAAARVFRLAKTEILAAGHEVTLVGGRDGQLLSIGKRYLDVAFILGGTALTVKRETGVLDLLRAELGILVDSKGEPTGFSPAYFSRLVLALVVAS